MKFDLSEFRVDEGRRVRLADWPTRAKPLYRSKEHYAELLAGLTHELSERQDMLYAHNRYALLLVLQAMDTAGKDGAIKHVMSGINPQGCQVFAFKAPSAEELDHDFLWRTNRCLPERGRIGIFNRSYYEEVLVVRVHEEFLRGQGLPDEARTDPDLWKDRYRSIREMERHLHANGTRTVKVFLHLSREEQRRRLLARIDDPAKNWKFSAGDLAERARWKDYQRAYEDCLGATNTRRAPWYVIPADDKPNARLILSQVLIETFDRMKMSYPKLAPAQRRELKTLRSRLAK